MLKSVNEQHQKAIREWMDLSEFNIPVAVTLTHKKSVSSVMQGRPVDVRLTKTLARQNFRHFLNRLNKEVFRNATKRHGKKIQAYAALEGGLASQRFEPEKHLHYHAVIDCPKGIKIKDFRALIKKLWLETQWGDRQMTIKFFADDGAIVYMTKPKDKYSVTDAIDWVNVHKN